MKQINVLILATFVGIVACSPKPTDSPSAKEAQKIQQQMKSLAEEVAESIRLEMVDMKRSVDSSLQAGDSLLAKKMSSTSAHLDSLQRKLEAWQESKIDMPHDHSACDGHHDHAHEALVESLSDEEMLSIQQELEEQLEAISAELEELKKQRNED